MRGYISKISMFCRSKVFTFTWSLSFDRNMIYVAVAASDAVLLPLPCGTQVHAKYRVAHSEH